MFFYLIGSLDQIHFWMMIDEPLRIFFHRMWFNF
jgi:hypothetical protein